MGECNTPRRGDRVCSSQINDALHSIHWSHPGLGMLGLSRIWKCDRNAASWRKKGMNDEVRSTLTMDIGRGVVRAHKLLPNKDLGSERR